jgi:hypothetical protein
MAVPIIVLDGSGQSYGTDGITTNTALALILDDISFQRAVDVATDRKSTGAPNRWRSTAGFDTLTATAQIPSSGTLPKFGDYFALTIDANYGSETWVFDPISLTKSNDPTQMNKLPITCKKAYNGNPTVINA